MFKSIVARGAYVRFTCGRRPGMLVGGFTSSADSVACGLRGLPVILLNTMKKLIVLLASIVALVALSITALSHHSFAMFDLTKRVNITGVVTKIEWTNPHVWVEADVRKDGSLVRWGIEFTSINHLTRLGMKSNTIKVGETVEFTVNPYANGTPGGRFQMMKLPDGKYFCDVGAAQRLCEEMNKR